jgi:hypothetical protein
MKSSDTDESGEPIPEIVQDTDAEEVLVGRVCRFVWYDPGGPSYLSIIAVVPNKGYTVVDFSVSSQLKGFRSLSFI